MKYRVTLQIEINIPNCASRDYLNDAVDDEMERINDANGTWSHLITLIQSIEG